jgi:hypothetical protein
LLRNTHLVPTTFWLGRGTKCHTSFLVNLLSSSCIATTQSGSLSASSILYSSIEDTKRVMFTKMSTSRSSSNPLVNVTKYVVDGVIFLNCLVDSWVWRSLILNLLINFLVLIIFISPLINVLLLRWLIILVFILFFLSHVLFLSRWRCLYGR